MAVDKGVGEGGNAAVGIDGKKKWLFLGVFGYVNFVGFVGDAGVGRGALMEILG